MTTAAAPRTMTDQPPEAIRLFIVTAFGAAGVPVPAELDAQAYLQAKYLAQGKSIPKWLTGRAAANTSTASARSVTPPDPFEGREVTGLFLSPSVDGKPGTLIKQIRAGPDEGPQFAEPASPWDVTNEDDDGRARGDEGILRRRRMRELERKLNALPFADREGRAGEALRKEIEELREAERAERYRRNYGSDGLGDASPTGAQPAGQQYAAPVSPWSRQAVEGAPEVPTLESMTDAEAERLRTEAIRLQGVIEDTTASFTERTQASAKLAKIEAKLRAAGRSIELGRAGGPRPQP